MGVGAGLYLSFAAQHGV